MLRNQKGFTLMELMIVIVIIGVLAAIGVPAYNSYVAKAKKTVCFTNLRVLNTAVEMHKMEKGAAPADIDALAAYIPSSAPLRIQVLSFRGLAFRAGW